MSTFGDDYDCLALPYFTVLKEMNESSRMKHHCSYLVNALTHVVFPWISGRWTFGNEYEISASSNACHQCEPSAVSTHNLYDERPRVRECGGVDVINGFADSVKSCRSTNCQIGHAHVIVDRPDKASDLEMRVSFSLRLCDSTCFKLTTQYKCYTSMKEGNTP